MKKLLGILVLGLLWCSNSNSADPYVGTGELKLSENVVERWMEYVRNTFKTPSGFLLPQMVMVVIIYIVLLDNVVL